MLCRHCDRFPVGRPRGLCWSCYYRPGVRERYPPAAHTGRRGIGFGSTRRPAEPTDAVPGSIEKVRVLMQRAINGQELFHPDDASLTFQPLEPALAG